MDDKILNYDTIDLFISDINEIKGKLNNALTVITSIDFRLENETFDGPYFGQALEELQLYDIDMKFKVSELLGYVEIVEAYIAMVKETVQSEDNSIKNSISNTSDFEVKG